MSDEDTVTSFDSEQDRRWRLALTPTLSPRGEGARPWRHSDVSFSPRLVTLEARLNRSMFSMAASVLPLLGRGLGGGGPSFSFTISTDTEICPGDSSRREIRL